MTRTLFPTNAPRRTLSITSRYPPTGSFPSSCRTTASGTPRSTSAATVISPAIPLKQSKYSSAPRSSPVPSLTIRSGD